jgi:hypothetical protein
MIGLGCNANHDLCNNAFKVSSCSLRCSITSNNAGRGPTIARVSVRKLSSRFDAGGVHVPGRVIQRAGGPHQRNSLQVLALRNIDEPEVIHMAHQIETWVGGKSGLSRWKSE